MCSGFLTYLHMGCITKKKRASDYTQHSLVDALLEHVAKFILDAFSRVSSKAAFTYKLSQQKAVLTRSKAGQNPLLCTQRTCTVIFINQINYQLSHLIRQNVSLCGGVLRD